MSTPFSRTLRSLHADSFRGSSWLVLLGLLALILWFSWFFLAQIFIYETSQSASIQPENKVMAFFPLSTAGRIRPGQSAQMQLYGLVGDRFGNVPAQVIEVRQSLEGMQVILGLQPVPGSTVQLQTGLKGTVKIEIEQASPASLVLRAISPAGQPVFPPFPLKS
jgi:hypothetical protein